MDITVHRSAGRYECGEETALLNALEGKRPNPRSKPPFPLVEGFWKRPTVINNVETILNVPHIITMGPEAWKCLAVAKGGAGVKLYGMFELGIGVTLRELIEEHAGGMKLERKFKACLPGGASTPVMTAEHLDVPMDFGPVEAAGSRLGTGCVTVFDDKCCMVGAAVNLITFFARESCGWCTPCRDGLQYVLHLLKKIESGEASHGDVDTLAEQCEIIYPSSFCAFAPGAVGPVQSVLKHFRDEVDAHISLGRCPVKGGS
jgi:NADH-quinone oxidoreductase subunit F